MEASIQWQDLVLAVGQLLLFIALLPSIFSKHKPDYKTSLVTGIILAVFAYTFWSLGLTYGSFSSSLASLGWFILFFQKVVTDRKV